MPPEVIKIVQKMQQNSRVIGQGKPIISTEFQDRRAVAVGGELLVGHWKTFHDFLVYYCKRLFSTWGDEELKKPENEQHTILRWYRSLCHLQKMNPPKNGEVIGAPCTGPVAAFMLLAYNLYTLAHNRLLQKRLIARLKNPDQFQGALYEMYVAAVFIRAGFEIEFENEDDPTTSHCEYIATYKQDGQKFSVEAKSKHRAGIMGYQGERQTPEEIKLNIWRQLNSAVKKHAEFPRVVFIDVNMPPEIVKISETSKLPETSWFNELFQSIEKEENHFLKKGGVLPPAYLFITNNPLDWVDNSQLQPSIGFFSTGFGMEDFKKQSLDKEKHKHYLKLIDALNAQGIPVDF